MRVFFVSADRSPCPNRSPTKLPAASPSSSSSAAPFALFFFLCALLAADVGAAAAFFFFAAAQRAGGDAAGLGHEHFGGALVHGRQVARGSKGRVGVGVVLRVFPGAVVSTEEHEGHGGTFAAPCLSVDDGDSMTSDMVTDALLMLVDR